MFITIDGLAGAGKSTQLRMLSKELGMHGSYIEPPRQALCQALTRCATTIGVTSEYMVVPAHILAKCVLDIRPETDCISDHYWQPFFDVYRKAPKTFGDVLNILRTGITICGHSEPNLSIILDVPPDIAQRRHIKRHFGRDAKRKMTQRELAHHTNYQQFCKALESKLDYCYITDGKCHGGNYSITAS